MIASLWSTIEAGMTRLGYVLDADEASLADHRYTIKLPAAARNDGARTFSAARVTRDIRVRLQFRSRKDPLFERDISTEVERVVTALRPTLLFEESALEERTGGMIAEIHFSALDSMS